MTELEHDPDDDRRDDAREDDRTRTGLAGLTGLALVGVIAASVLVTWLLVKPAPAGRAPSAASPLEDTFFEVQRAGDHARGTGTARLESYAWLDRGAGIARIPIDQAIDAVLADPSLLARAPAQAVHP
jgi:hypothetical protein